MESSKKKLLFKVSVFTFIAVAAVLLPGAISIGDAAFGHTAGQEAESIMRTSVSGISREMNANFAELGSRDPLFVLQITSQKFENRHSNLWK